MLPSNTYSGSNGTRWRTMSATIFMIDMRGACATPSAASRSGCDTPDSSLMLATTRARESRAHPPRRELPADQALASVELEFLRRRRRHGSVLVRGLLLHGQRGVLAVDDEHSVGLDVLRELLLGRRHFLHHARHHRAILGGHGLPLILHLFGRELVGLVHLAGVGQAHLLDRDLAARVIEDRRALDFGLPCRGGAAQSERQRGADAKHRESTMVHLFFSLARRSR